MGRCIFCKNDSASSISIEHIIPESLGNIDHVLQRGVVCDTCNNYISRKIEKPFLDLTYIKECRFNAGIQSKKKRIPPLDGINLRPLSPIQLIRWPNEPETAINFVHDSDRLQFVKSMQKNATGTFIMPISTKPPANDYVVSRFIAKIGLEVLAFRATNNQQVLNEIIDNVGLDELRTYVRRGSPGKIWPYSRREIYPSDFMFHDRGQDYTIPHEFDILSPNDSEYYIVLAIFGDEYVLNLGGRCVGGYKRWLKENKGKSPLYHGKNMKK